MLLFAVAAACVATEPNPPQWPPTVHVIGPESATGNATVHAVYKEQYDYLYTDSRAALLFKPGVYSFDVPVGYYTTVHGLGVNPEDVSFVGEHGVHPAFTRAKPYPILAQRGEPCVATNLGQGGLVCLAGQ